MVRRAFSQPGRFVFRFYRTLRPMMNSAAGGGIAGTP
jgi:hypothetical protein